MTDDIGRKIQQAAAGVSAPLTLREELRRSRPGQPPAYPSRRSLATMGAVLAIVATLAGLLAPGAPSVERVAKRALNGSTGPAPEGSAYFAGFRAVGARTDTIAGRRAETVIYRRGTVGVHYTIVDGKPLDLPGSRRVKAGRITLALARDGDVNLVAWHARGKTCILASRAASVDNLTELVRRA